MCSRGDTPGPDESRRLDSGSDAENAVSEIESAGIEELVGGGGNGRNRDGRVHGGSLNRRVSGRTRLRRHLHFHQHADGTRAVQDAGRGRRAGRSRVPVAAGMRAGVGIHHRACGQRPQRQGRRTRQPDNRQHENGALEHSPNCILTSEMNERKWNVPRVVVQFEIPSC